MFIIGCSASENNTSLKGYFEVESIDNESIDYYNVIILKNTKNEKLILLSFRLGTGVDKPPFEKYALIEAGKKYRFNLVKQDSVYVVNQHYITPGEPYKIFLEGILFIENDTIKATVYRSEDVFDKFVKIK